jgi:large subunit ribosomal protein L17
MRHFKKGRKFHRKKGQRNALFKSLLNNLILEERIETTEEKAKEIRPKIEKLITLAKKQNLASLRLLMSRLNKRATQKIYSTLAPRYQDRKGGYVRIIKGVKKRIKDRAKMALIEFV